MQALDDLARLVGRLLVAALFLPSGVGKAMNLAGFTGMLAGKGVPFPEILAILGAAAEIVGPILLILGLAPRITAVVVGGFCLVAALISHNFWTFTDEAAQLAQRTQFLKNAAITGGMMFYFVSGSGRFSLGNGKY
ncbi:membrane protein [Azorhizobium oxalatiphilum]|uniref:Membrane protein n=1 Tax=Azorhizobium oxalatiphilum TaxID=980631 RepID=A0A917FEG7_9HYPH|nr:DoxX family protein [Azorhizobium oxalatiphilum]GGF75773.1 membrane protein [Azorhizobium oxalatiphilum]